MGSGSSSGSLAAALRGTPLSALGLDTTARHHLARRTITTVEELRAAVASSPSLAFVLDPEHEGNELRSLLQSLGPSVLDAPAPPRTPLEHRIGLLTSESSRRSQALDSPSPSSQWAAPDEAMVGPADLITTIHDRLAPPRDQDQRPTCVAHAVSAAVELHHRRDGFASGDELLLSPEFVHYHAKQIDGAPEGGGTFLWAAVDRLKDAGVCQEHLWPYDGTIKDDYGVPSQSALDDGELRRAGATSKASDTIPIDGLIEALDREEPVVIGVRVFPLWDSQAVRANGKVLIPEDDAMPVGAHALCLVGYGYSPAAFGDEHPYFFLARNSWGTWWADSSPIAKGHVILPARYIELHGVEFAQLSYLA